MDLMTVGAQLLQSKLSQGGGDTDNIISALSGLLGDGQGGLDLGNIIASMQGGNLADIASSWLGSGSNQSVDVDQLRDLFGGDKVSQFASQLGTDEDSALQGLSEALPEMINQGSPGGSLLDSVGGIGGLANMAKGFLK